MYAVLDLKSGTKEDSVVTVSSLTGGVITASFEALKNETLYVVAKPKNYDILSFFPTNKFRSVVVVNPWLLKKTGECDESFLVNSPGFFTPIFFQPLDSRNTITYRVLSGASNNHPLYPFLIKAGMSQEMILSLMREVVDPRWFYNGKRMVNAVFSKLGIREGSSPHLVKLAEDSIAENSPLYLESLIRFEVSRSNTSDLIPKRKRTFEEALLKTAVDFLLQQWIGKINLDFKFSDSFFRSDTARKLYKKSR